ncbi:hypothetical protein A3A46_04145 [Candidatus Roizmanbacteria bacterium RIFCSPLOWO2_01_FULL_37_13]|uniref:HD domain-containing protein n=1 Tax=Candidatus Roizmanbacteria bacterium RIFCSPHIGHO2_02_FULL_38_11 TaxID=1802039 RepID=A0A1F7H1P8_9BACT|nr:MAG: hypothetical protein A3C25_03290 [Candidatus Roizmanbacteria bacterium RIFCSPHIGHO2_02_FULL_38_11]OGK40966.1 MAG: hypothetical protein A3A46_04145 [Candidatus Roizmanbacteria bacterium RIFCSPLOWO2_01_FULL_37_13]
MTEVSASDPIDVIFKKPISEPQATIPELERLYQEQRSTIQKIYRGVDTWHGTGRYGNRGQIDILRGIASTRQLIPHRDVWDPSLGESETISTTWMRPYAAAYADMHLEKGKELSYSDFRSGHYWIKYIKRLTLPEIFNLLKYARALNRTRKDAIDWIEKKIGRQLSSERDIAGFTRLRSSIPDNYPILIGIKPGAFQATQKAAFLSRTERRTDQQILIDMLTHLEVPLDRIAETQAILKENKVELPVLPRELCERYSAEFSDRELLTGEGFREEQYPIPQVPTSRVDLEPYIPKEEWFTSLDRSRSAYHGIDHLTRVLILQETITNLLIQSGELQPDTVNRVALRWSAVVHDLRRHSDFIGRGHAQAGANWALQNLPADIPLDTKDKILKIVQAHDQEVDPDSDVAKELSILKDADALDRIRLESRLPVTDTPKFLRRKVALDPGRLCLDISKKLIPFAHELYRLSTYNRLKRSQKAGVLVLDAGSQLGVLTK